jgi:hypothetical protein
MSWPFGIIGTHSDSLDESPKVSAVDTNTNLLIFSLLIGTAVWCAILTAYIYLLHTERGECVMDDGWLRYLNDHSPWKAYNDVKKLGQNRWVRLYAPELSEHSRSVAQGAFYTVGSGILCIVAARYHRLQRACALLQEKLATAGSGSVLTPHQKALTVDPFSTPPRRPKQIALCDTPSPLPNPQLRLVKYGNDADAHYRRQNVVDYHQINRIAALASPNTMRKRRLAIMN